jgi:uncharacterized protein (TIGR03437 family)
MTVKSLLAGLALAACLGAQAPDYTAAGIVNGASFAPGPLAPNTVASLFGTNLAWSEKAMGRDDIVGNEMPTKLAGVQVFVAWYRAHLYYVSPNQVNFLIPSFLRPGVVDIGLVRDGIWGPVVQVTLDDASPALFQTADGQPIATHLDYSLVTRDAPASPGEIIVLYATGLGCVQDPGDDGTLPQSPQWLCSMDRFRVWIGGVPVDPELVQYAGVAPGFAGLYQVNLKMPRSFPPNPELRIGVGDSRSAAGLILPAR